MHMKKCWHRRGYLPHFDGTDISQHIVFRVFDATPAGAHDGDDVLDRHYGTAFMRDPRCARIVAQTLLHGDCDRYALQAWCVTPNHVHALIFTHSRIELGQIVRSWKTYTTRRMNELPNRSGPVWATDYFDRFIRDEKHFHKTKTYIEMNPVGAGLCDKPEAWPFSSAGWARGA